MKIYIVEDDPFFGEALSYQLALNPDYKIERFTTGKDFLSHLDEQPSAVSLDFILPDMTGMEVLKKIKDKYPHMPVFVLSAQQEMETALALFRAGAEDYIIKNEEAIHRLRRHLKNIYEKRSPQDDVENQKVEVVKNCSFSNIIGKSKSMQAVYKQMEKAVNSPITVSITGDTGTGKELVAKSIHSHSNRKKKNFVAVNVAAIPSDLIESELFGHEKGAFTGAIDRRIGKFELAHKGTLFLDEIAEMDLSMQSKLLRVLQEREIVRIGGNQTIQVDFRLIIATHRKLFSQVEKGEFREDLFYRLLGLQINLPTLKDRKEDVIPIAEFFLKQIASNNKSRQVELSKAAKNKLLNYSFPGNIRELRAIMELAFVMAEDAIINESDILFQEGVMVGRLLQEHEDTLKGYTRRIVKHYLDRYNNDYDIVSSKLAIGKSTIYHMKRNEEI
ncbi:sigma-54-dependent transcriptional regulator [Chondrinema litorale]|uniref:sigma-54-dependent transcriptional regulator n=1 Tax=Chondrinema litorale TaxID=2994555 RepID=UPI002543F99D|nr:sigma-54 dependent transcriptional regulator [Chondrinema litorale]UZR99577.1 sigma-54 dependent transcriptional regulator [Chondrinema litorale]